jgi:hypothetical protein
LKEGSRARSLERANTCSTCKSMMGTSGKSFRTNVEVVADVHYTIQFSSFVTDDV